MKSAIKKTAVLVLLSLVLIFTGCGQTINETGDLTDSAGFTAPTTITAQKNEAVKEQLDLSDPANFDQVRKGLIASEPNLTIQSDQAGTVWDMTAYTFIKGESPASVNPSLWRQAKLNNIHGLFKVTPGSISGPTTGLSGAMSRSSVFLKSSETSTNSSMT